jgi:hypothetical protein
VLRGLRPTVDELAGVDDVRAVADRVDAWVESPEFGLVIRDMHAEWWLVRNDLESPLPSRGPLTGTLKQRVLSSTQEAPLRFVEAVVADDLPYTALFDADWTLADPVVAAIYGLEYDPAGPEWQRTEWSDGRPRAGILSDSEIWRRHVSNGNNNHRARADFVARAFLCADFSSRDIPLEAGLDMSDEAAIAQAVREVPSCVACHQALDPLAAFFWGYKEQLRTGAVSKAYDQDCRYDWTREGEPARGSYLPDHFCYPALFYEVEQEDGWVERDLRPPGFYGESAGDVRDLGQMLVRDPRFHQCTARRFAAWMTQSELDEVPDPWVRSLADGFVASGFDTKELVRSIALSEAFAGVRAESDTFVAGVQLVRPEQYARTVEALTGFRWEISPDPIPCAGCWGTVDLGRQALHGFRSMLGGTDGFQVTRPSHTVTPSRLLAVRRFAAEAAGYAVDRDFATARLADRLLITVSAETVDEAAIRGELAGLYARVIGLPASSDDVDAYWSLWSGTLDRRGDTDSAWKLTLAALLQDPALLTY